MTDLWEGRDIEDVPRPHWNQTNDPEAFLEQMLRRFGHYEPDIMLIREHMRLGDGIWRAMPEHIIEYLVGYGYPQSALPAMPDIFKAHDGDGDFVVNENTKFERPKGPGDTPKKKMDREKIRRMRRLAAGQRKALQRRDARRKEAAENKAAGLVPPPITTTTPGGVATGGGSGEAVPFLALRSQGMYRFSYGDFEWETELSDNAYGPMSSWGTWEGNYGMRAASASMLGHPSPKSSGGGSGTTYDIAMVTGRVPEGRTLTPESESEIKEKVEFAYRLMQMIGNKEYVTPEDVTHYRGLVVSKDDGIVNVSVGDEFDMPLTAFTPSVDIAHNFAMEKVSTLQNEGKREVIIKLLGGASVAPSYLDSFYDEGPLDKDGPWDDDDPELWPWESVTAGRFRVVSVEWPINQMYNTETGEYEPVAGLSVEVTIEQVGTQDMHGGGMIHKSFLGIPDWVWKLDGAIPHPDDVTKAHDGDGDQRVHDGTNAERPKGPGDTPKIGTGRATRTSRRVRTASSAQRAQLKSGLRPATDEDRKRLRIPPAWTDVEVSEDPEGVNGLLARGRDAKGRRQGRYSAAHTEAQAAVKFNRVKRIAPALPAFDRRLKKDALTNDNAGALTIIRRLGMRLGGEGDTGADVKAYGANTLERRHVSIEGRKVTFDFIGKKGVHITITSSDPEVLRVVRSRLANDGKDDDQLFPKSNVDSVRAYLRSYMPEETLVKDLRTIRANELALEAISTMGRTKTMTEYKKARLQVGEIVSGQLGNNRSEALKSYINPTVFLMLLPEGVEPQL